MIRSPVSAVLGSMKQTPPDFLDGMRKDKPEVDAMNPDKIPGQDNKQAREHEKTSEKSRDPVGLSTRLPGDEDVWKQSPLGHPEGWSQELRSYALTLSSFAYPAAIFWDEELILIHNDAWTEAGGKAEQGERQRGNLSADSFPGHVFGAPRWAAEEDC